ncbi:MAG: tetratricopeptide repeat protein [Bacteroidales bacterium]
MKTNDFSYFIERFNAGEMDEAEKQWFRREIDGNQKLRNEVDIRQKADAILKKQDVINLRSKLNLIEKKRETDVSPRKHQRLIKIKYAALIACLVTLGGIALISNKNPGNEEIMERYYRSYEATSSLRSGVVIDNPDFNLALEYYKIHDYRIAAIYFSRALENKPGDMQAALLEGISNFEIENYPEAKKSFGNVIDDRNNLYIDHARWYLALCYIKTEEMQKAAEQLAVIERSKSIYKKDARKLGRNLK